MCVLGAPKIEVVDCGDHYQALEGSHRLAAAAVLDLAPELIIREQIAGEVFSARQAVPYQFDL